MSRRLELTDQTFGDLTVIAMADPILWRRQETQWVCTCRCGGLSITRRSDLTSGKTRSCGCKQGFAGCLPQRRVSGPEHHLWKGDEASYGALHDWVARHKTKSGVCTSCEGKAKTQWANVSGEYHRDLDDFAEMCGPCHKRFDLDRQTVA